MLGGSRDGIGRFSNAVYRIGPRSSIHGIRFASRDLGHHGRHYGGGAYPRGRYRNHLGFECGWRGLPPVWLYRGRGAVVANLSRAKNSHPAEPFYLLNRPLGREFAGER